MKNHKQKVSSFIINKRYRKIAYFYNKNENI